MPSRLRNLRLFIQAVGVTWVAGDFRFICQTECTVKLSRLVRWHTTHMISQSMLGHGLRHYSVRSCPPGTGVGLEIHLINYTFSIFPQCYQSCPTLLFTPQIWLDNWSTYNGISWSSHSTLGITNLAKKYPHLVSTQ